MTYRFKISLPNIKGFARVYDVNANNSLYQFHKAMLTDMDFPQDQMILFKGLDDNEEVIARYATFDLGQGSVDCISIAKAIEAGITHFIYFYDTTNKRSVIVTLVGISDAEVSKPTLVESKGPNPIDFINGFVAFEDLPPEKRRLPRDDDDEDFDDDLDDEDDEEEDDDEDGAEIYDENL